MDHRPHPALFVPLLVWAMVAGTVFYPAFAVQASAVIADLALTPTTFGLFLFVFSATSAAFSPRGGRLTDRLGGRRAIALTFALTAADFLGLALSPSLVALSMASVLVALGQTMMNPSTNKLIADLTEPGSRGVITGVKQSGVYVGYVIVGVLSPPMAALWGWRSFLVLLALLVGLGAVAALWILPFERPGPPIRRRERPRLEPWVNALAVYGFVMGMGSSSSAFLPLYAESSLGFSNSRAGLLASVLGLLAIVTRIAGARLAERTGRYKVVLAIMGATGVVFGLTALASATRPGLIWPAAVAFSLGFSAWNAVGMLAVIDIAGARTAGAATGRVLMGFLGGLALGPVLYGRLIDATTFPMIWPATAAFAAVAIVAIGRWHPPSRS